MKINLLFLCLLWSHHTFAQKEIPLYDGKPKGSEEWDWSEKVSKKDQNIWNTKLVYNVVEPSITAYLPPYYLATGTSVIIAPGGGFHALSINSEGVDLAKWLNSKGVAAFVLKYRLAKCLTDDPGKEFMEKKSVEADAIKVSPLALVDGLEAVKYIRNHAAELAIDPNKIGFMGFSAGGTLTMNVAYNAETESRPNFIAPIYAWDVGQIGGKVPKDTMPIFITVAQDDPLELLPHSLAIYQKWIAAKQAAELHVYQKGGHGFGMRTQYLPTDTWQERFGDWLQVQGLLKKVDPNKYEKLYGQDAVARGKIERVQQMQTDYAQLARYKAANESLAPPKRDENRVVFLGNSITEAWAHVDSAFFANNNFIGRGISGQTSPQLLLRFQQDVLALQPKAVVLHIGTNDVAENTGPYDPNYTMSNIKSMVALAKAHNIKVILAAVLPATKFEWNRKLGDRSAKIADLNKRIKTFAAKENIAYDLAADGVHPTAKGYEIMKGLVLPIIQDALK